MITPDELVTLSPKALDLVREIREATDKSGPGGAKITKAEARQLLRAAASLVVALAGDLID